MIKNKEFTPKAKGDGRVVIRARMSYVHLDEPWTGTEGAEKKYSVSCIIPKDDKATVDAIRNAIEEAKEAGKGKKWKGTVPKKLQISFRDGDEEKEDEAYENSYFFNANAAAKTPVKCYNRLKEEIDPSSIYSGCWALVSVTFFPYDTNGAKGVSAGLNQVLFWADDQPLGNGRGNDFADLELDDDDDLDDM